MPELPEVEAILGQLRPSVTGATLAKVTVLKSRTVQPQSPEDLARSEGKRIQSLERRGKNILVLLSGGLALRVHLRMTGILRVIPDSRLYTASTRVLFALKDRRGLAFEDRRILGTIHIHSKDELAEKLQKLGPEPLTRAFTPKHLIDAAARSTRPIKVWLMDQQTVAGLGNIYAAESLFRAGIHPSQRANQISETKLPSLHSAICRVLRLAIKDAAKSYRAPDRHEGMHYDVYGRKGEPCHVCGKKIKTIEQGGRTTYFCANCQRK